MRTLKLKVKKNEILEEITTINCENDNVEETKTLKPIINEEKKKLVEEIQQAYKEGYSKRKIAKIFAISRNTVDKYISGNPEILAQRNSKAAETLDQHLNFIIEECASKTNVLKSIWKKLCKKGVDVDLTSFYKYCKRLIEEGLMSKDSKPNSKSYGTKDNKKLYRYITRNQIFKYIWCNDDSEISKELFEHICNKYDVIRKLDRLLKKFRSVFKNKSKKKFGKFISMCIESQYNRAKTFAEGLMKDISPVIMGITTRYNNGFVEGINNKLKMVKRVSYGRCKYTLLRAKIVLSSFYS